MLRRLINPLTFSKPEWGPKVPPDSAWFLPLPRELEYCLLENRVVGIRVAGFYHCCWGCSWVKKLVEQDGPGRDTDFRSVEERIL